MREKGIEPPPKPDEALEQVRETRMGKLLGYMAELDKWFRLLRDALPKVQTTEVTIDVASVAANTTAEQTFTVVGLTTNDIVRVVKPSHNTGLGIVNVRCSAADTLAITFMNVTGSPIDPGSETYLVEATRR